MITKTLGLNIYAVERTRSLECSRIRADLQSLRTLSLILCVHLHLHVIITRITNKSLYYNTSIYVKQIFVHNYTIVVIMIQMHIIGIITNIVLKLCS